MKVVYNNQTEFAQALFLCYLYTEPYDYSDYFYINAEITSHAVVDKED